MVDPIYPEKIFDNLRKAFPDETRDLKIKILGESELKNISLVLDDLVSYFGLYGVWKNGCFVVSNKILNDLTVENAVSEHGNE